MDIEMMIASKMLLALRILSEALKKRSKQPPSANKGHRFLRLSAIARPSLGSVQSTTPSASNLRTLYMLFQLHPTIKIGSCSSRCPMRQVTTAWLLACFAVRTVITECVDRHVFSERPATGSLESPAFPTPYRADLSCLYNISTITSNVIHLTFLSFDLAEKHRSSGQCLEAYVLVIVVDRLGKEHIGERLCGTKTPAKIETMQPTVYVQFVTTAPGRQHRGFRIRYEIISEALVEQPSSYLPDDEKAFERSCGGATKPGQLTGEVVSPGYPTTFPRNTTCYWLIRVEPRQRIYIRLEHLYLSSTIAECERASLSIMDGYKHDSKTIKKEVAPDFTEARFCGSQLYYMEEGMKSYLSSANRILVRFNTKDRPSPSLVADRIGFKLIWTAVENAVNEPQQSPSSSVRLKQGTVQDTSCTQFACHGGQICVEKDQGVCVPRPQLCIHSSLVCNGVQNCVEGDYSDEQHCYSREIIISALGGALVLITIVIIVVCCNKWRKRRRERAVSMQFDLLENGMNL
ncbi:hypothetical protein KIN20_027184 [Parelaphostrongylus tenuis]|uniref:CUB domain-containing protein n=1 Tax=Parelaphostrongylus tenuis TaxID=148309 RepID=A0AAD5QZ07_PARTN|nr:hypothetical protein KIN20_027184 [Parelaphostrongylus tenuis]